MHYDGELFTQSIILLLALVSFVSFFRQSNRRYYFPLMYYLAHVIVFYAVVILRDAFGITPPVSVHRWSIVMRLHLMITIVLASPLFNPLLARARKIDKHG